MNRRSLFAAAAGVALAPIAAPAVAASRFGSAFGVMQLSNFTVDLEALRGAEVIASSVHNPPLQVVKRPSGWLTADDLKRMEDFPVGIAPDFTMGHA